MEANVHCLNHFDAIEGLNHCVRCGRIFCSDCLVRIGGIPYCGPCKNEQVLDVQSGVTALQDRYASIGRRFLALLIDSIIIGIPMQIFSGAAQLAATVTKNATVPLIVVGIVTMISMGVTIAYEALMLLKRNGQTIGKLALQIKVVRVDGSPLSPREAWIRPVVRTFTAILCLADYFPAFFTAERTAIHDMAANTRVISV